LHQIQLQSNMENIPLDQNMTKDSTQLSKKENLMKHSMSFGAFTGGALILHQLIIYLFNLQGSVLVGVFSYLILGGGMVWSSVNYRLTYLEGSITYGKSWVVSTLTGLFSGVILGFYIYVFVTFVDTGFIDTTLKFAEQSLIESGTPADVIEMQVKVMRKMMTPTFLTFSTVLGTMFQAMLLALITSIFVKRSQKQQQNFTDEDINKL